MDPYKPKDKKDKTVQKKAIKKNAIKFTKIVSLVGIRHATDSRNSTVRRIVWMAWLVLGSAVAYYQTHDCIERFFKYPALTEMKIVTGITKIEFPQVTICGDNQIMAKKAREKSVFQEIAYVENTMQRIRVYDERPYYTNASYLKNIAIRQLDDYITKLSNWSDKWETLSRALAPSIEDAILKVEFNEKSYYPKQTPKNLSEIVTEVVTDIGHCYAFGSKDTPLTTTKQGPFFGLNIILLAKSLEIIPSVRFLANHDSLPGFKVLIHDPRDVPRMRDTAFSVKRGTSVRVTLAFENITKQGQPYGNCRDNDTSYRESYCTAKCEYDLFVSKCGCKDIHMNITELADIPFCSLGQILNCTRTFNEYDQKNSQVNTTCNHTCDQQCNRQEYKTEITQTKLSIVLDESTRGGDANTDDAMTLEIYYPLMSYFEANEVAAYSVFKLLCDIGNALSLLLGATLLTIYESLEFVFLFVADYARFRFGK